jgi:hypothetical protein
MFLSLSLSEDGGDVFVETAAQKKFLKYTTPPLDCSNAVKSSKAKFKK